MEFTKAEVELVEQVTTQKEVTELNELQLALIGGGIGDPVWA